MSDARRWFKLQKAIKSIDDQGIDVGDIIRVSWSVDDAYGGGIRSHTGPLKSLDKEGGWFEVAPSVNSPGHFRSYIGSSYQGMEKLGEEEAQKIRDQIEQFSKKPNEDKKPVKRNPFLELKGS